MYSSLGGQTTIPPLIITIIIVIITLLFVVRLLYTMNAGAFRESIKQKIKKTLKARL